MSSGPCGDPSSLAHLRALPERMQFGGSIINKPENSVQQKGNWIGQSKQSGARNTSPSRAAHLIIEETHKPLTTQPGRTREHPDCDRGNTLLDKQTNHQWPGKQAPFNRLTLIDLKIFANDSCVKNKDKMWRTIDQVWRLVINIGFARLRCWFVVVDTLASSAGHNMRSVTTGFDRLACRWLAGDRMLDQPRQRRPVAVSAANKLNCAVWQTQAS